MSNTSDALEKSMEEQRLTIVPETKANEVVPLNIDTAFYALTPESQQQVKELADSIDVLRTENVMAYGSEVLKKTFEQCGKFLESEKGSEADQEVIKRVMELTKKASESYDDFEMVLEEPNFFEKLFLSISGKKKEHAKKVQTRAVTNYKLLAELSASCESWLEILKNAMGDITFSEISDSSNLDLLEKYIIAGEMAKKRIEAELSKAHEEADSTGLRVQAQKYDDLKEGYDIFTLRLNNLEKSRVMYYLSIAQLSLIKRSNRNVQIAVHTQSENCMSLIAQQLRNAVLNAKNQEVIEGQKALSRLSDELIKDVSKSVGITADEAEKLLYYGSYNAEAAKEAVKMVISSCESIKHVAEEMLPKMKADVTELNSLISELKPYIDESAKPQENSPAPTNSGSGSLKF